MILLNDSFCSPDYPSKNYYNGLQETSRSDCIDFMEYGDTGMTNNTIVNQNHFVTAIKNLKEKSYAQAEQQIKEAMLDDPHSPAVHNLYGILGGTQER